MRRIKQRRAHNEDKAEEIALGNQKLKFEVQKNATLRNECQRDEGKGFAGTAASLQLATQANSESLAREQQQSLQLFSHVANSKALTGVNSGEDFH